MAVLMTPPTIQQTLDLALQHHQAGRLHEAEQLYRQILTQQPNHSDALHLLGLIAHQVGRNDIAVDLIRQAIAINTNFPEAHNNLSAALSALGRLDEAIVAARQAIVLSPNYPDAYYNLGNGLKDKGQFDEAESAYRQAISLKPNHPEAHCNLGTVLKEKGQLDPAIAAFRQAIVANPNWSVPHNNFGLALADNGQLDEAIVAFHRAVSLQPNYVDAHNNLGAALKNNGQLDEAITTLRQAIALNPNHAQAYSNLGNALTAKGQFDQAITAYRQAVALNPNSSESHNTLGVALRDHGQLDEAIAVYRQAITLQPNYADAYNNLGNALTAKGQPNQAIAAFRKAIALSPAIPQTHNNLSVALKDLAQLDEAIAAVREAISLDPNLLQAHSNLLYTLPFHPAYTPEAILEEHRNWSRQLAESLQKFIHPHTNDRSPDRRLRIGYVSPDFKDHCQSNFTIPLLSHHNHDQFEIFCYANVPRPDTFTDKIQGLANTWRSTVAMSDQQVADLVRTDRIDILIDLTMHMGNGRPLLFARKPAPMQVAWLAYPGTTGLSTIDYRLTDPYLDPPGQNDTHYVEKSIRLPDTFWCYQPMTAYLEINSPPLLKTNRITFGCLNNFCKINDGLLALWSSVLKAVPGSHLVLMSPLGEHRQKVLEKLGVESDRIEFVAAQPRVKYLEMYRRIDIGLDTYPVNGHTTSLDSFWMGVPVITLVSSTPMGRAGWCQLSNLGLTELAAQTTEQFVEIAANLANDLPRLQQLRSTLRQRMEQSPLMDAPKFARNIEAAYRQMWRAWCQTPSAKS
jgi:protein O-GlcNAc transferase